MPGTVRREALKVAMSSCSSGSRITLLLTALRSQRRLVLCKPVLLSAFQMAPVEPPSVRRKRRISSER